MIKLFSVLGDINLYLGLSSKNCLFFSKSLYDQILGSNLLLWFPRFDQNWTVDRECFVLFHLVISYQTKNVWAILNLHIRLSRSTFFDPDTFDLKALSVFLFLLLFHLFYILIKSNILSRLGPWYLYYMVAHNMLRTCGMKQDIS